MQQSDKTLADFFAMERDKLIQIYHNQFSSFELRLQALQTQKEMTTSSRNVSTIKNFAFEFQ